jgi:hypothetical protein
VLPSWVRSSTRIAGGSHQRRGLGIIEAQRTDNSSEGTPSWPEPAALFEIANGGDAHSRPAGKFFLSELRALPA